MIFPDDFEDFIGIVGCDGGPGSLVFDPELNELVPEPSFGVIGKPIVEVPAANSPEMGDSLGDDEGDCFNIAEEDGFGGSERKIVLIDHDEVLIDCNLAILVENFCHL